MSTARARSLRRAATPAERRLWQVLRDRRLGGFKFVRQDPIGPYFADFCCRSARLVVELDGSQHADSMRDKKRDAYLLDQRYRVLRFWNHEVTDNLLSVTDTIFAALDDGVRPMPSAPHPSPLPVSGERE